MINSKWLGSKGVAIFYLAFISFLFLLPGSALPGNKWFQMIHLDKWIHFGFFSILTILWSRAFNINKPSSRVLLFLVVLLYGSLVEVVQDRFIPNRGFEVWDIVADASGALAGIWVAGRFMAGVKK
jgi:VanZ family protein